MKLSEAIRKGAALRPQAYGSYWVMHHPDGVIGTCALGAAYEALTGSLPTWNEEADYWDEGNIQTIICNKTGVSQDILCQIIDHNDEDQTSRESIALWLEEQGY